MLPREDAQTFLEALEFFSVNPKANVFGDISRVELFAFLIDYFSIDDLDRVHYLLGEFAAGKIAPNTVPQEIIEGAKNRGLDKDALLVKMDRQRSQIKTWTAKIKSAKKQAAIQAAKEQATPPAGKKEVKEILGQEKEKLKPEEEVEINQIKIKVTEEDPQQAGLFEKEKAAAPFRKAAEQALQSDDINVLLTQPALTLYSKGISSNLLFEKANSLIDGNEKNFLLFTAQSIKEIENLFPGETAVINRLWGVKDIDIEINNEDSIPNIDLINFSLNSNGVFSAEGTENFGEGFTDSFGGEAIDLVAQQIVNKVSSAVTEKVMSTPLGMAVTNFASKVATQMGLGGLKAGMGAFGAKLGTGLANIATKLASLFPALGGKIGAAIGTLGAKIGTTLGSFGGPIVAIIGAIIGFLVGKIIEPIVRWIKKNKEALLAMLAVGGAGGFFRKIGSIILAVLETVFAAIAGPLIGIFIGLPVLVVIILFIINSGTYITPPPYSLGSTLNCGIDYESLPFSDTSTNLIAQKAYNIVSGGENIGLHRGFWCNWNKSPKYPKLFDEAAYQKDPNPCVSPYIFPGCTGNYNGLNMFWCTYLVLKSNREAGRPLVPKEEDDGTLTSSEVMKNWYDQRGKYIKIEDALKNITGNIQQGDTAIIHTSYSTNKETPRHVSIVWYADSDSIITIDSNGYFKTYSYTIAADKSGAYFGTNQFIIGIGKQ